MSDERIIMYPGTDRRKEYRTVEDVEAERAELERLRTLEQRLIRLFHPEPVPDSFDWTIVETIERQAAMLARMEEREACIKVAAELMLDKYRVSPAGLVDVKDDIAEAIRKRGQS